MASTSPSPKSTSSSISVRSESFRNLDSASSICCASPVAEVHLITRNDITSIEQLRGNGFNSSTPRPVERHGHPVCFSGGSTSSWSRPITGGFEQLRRANMTRSCAWFTKRSASELARSAPNSGLHILPIPYSKKFTDLMLG